MASFLLKVFLGPLLPKVLGFVFGSMKQLPKLVWKLWPIHVVSLVNALPKESPQNLTKSLGGPTEDVFSTQVPHSITRRISNGLIACVLLGLSCARWSRARRGKPGGRFPPPLRGDSASDIFGLPGLSEKDLEFGLGTRK